MKLISLIVAAVKDLLEEPDLHCAGCAKLVHKCECEDGPATLTEYLDEHPEIECPYCAGVEIHEVSCQLMR